jgi:hypothetical protein
LNTNISWKKVGKEKQTKSATSHAQILSDEPFKTIATFFLRFKNDERATFAHLSKEWHQ